jgi:mono/diheme cytochrome c family protein
MRRFAAFAVLLAAWGSSCTKKEPQAPLSPEEEAKAALVRKGKSAYMSYCSACHNANPSAMGALGPPLAEIPLATLESKVLYAKYPEGVQPRIPVKGVMPAMPHLKDEIAGMHAFLQTYKYTPPAPKK